MVFFDVQAEVLILILVITTDESHFKNLGILRLTKQWFEDILKLLN
jgi:hypothetical protein